MPNPNSYSSNLNFKIKNHLAYKLGSKILDFNQQIKECLQSNKNKSLFSKLYGFVRVGGGGNILINSPLSNKTKT